MLWAISARREEVADRPEEVVTSLTLYRPPNLVLHIRYEFVEPYGPIWVFLAHVLGDLDAGAGQINNLFPSHFSFAIGYESLGEVFVNSVEFPEQC